MQASETIKKSILNQRKKPGVSKCCVCLAFRIRWWVCMNQFPVKRFSIFLVFFRNKHKLWVNQNIFLLVFSILVFPILKAQTPWWLISGEMSDGSMAWRMAWRNGQNQDDWSMFHKRTQRNDSTIISIRLSGALWSVWKVNLSTGPAPFFQDPKHKKKPPKKHRSFPPSKPKENESKKKRRRKKL